MLWQDADANLHRWHAAGKGEDDCSLILSDRLNPITQTPNVRSNTDYGTIRVSELKTDRSGWDAPGIGTFEAPRERIPSRPLGLTHSRHADRE